MPWGSNLSLRERRVLLVVLSEQEADTGLTQVCAALQAPAAGGRLRHSYGLGSTSQRLSGGPVAVTRLRGPLPIFPPRV